MWIYVVFQCFVFVVAGSYGVKIIREDKRIRSRADANEEVWNKRAGMRKGGYHLYKNLLNCN